MATTTQLLIIIWLFADPANGSPQLRGDHWAFQPPRDAPLPGVEQPTTASSPIDRFVLAELERAGLSPVPLADRRTLIRRATFDLTGLPPTPEEIDAFLAEESPDAFHRLVDRLMAAPQYGERWGRHWLDVARYADSNGLDENVAHGNAWRYRDYVIRAFNSDKPYDRFLREQIAGDLLPSSDSPHDYESRVATAFLSLGPKVLAEGDQTKMEMDIIDEQLDTLGRAVMGLTLGCARCHDHKFDPISTEDYYALAGIFKSTQTMESFKRIARWYEHPVPSRLELARKAAHNKKLAAQEAELKKLTAESKKPKFPAADRKRLEELRASLKKLKDSAPVLASAMGVKDGKATDLQIHVRGSHLQLGKRVARRFPAVLSNKSTVPVPATGSGRLELARWLTRRDHPLTGRVIANRVWRWLFGRGLVSTPDNFGIRGVPPTHPELLDHLALRLMDEGWSIKRLVRNIIVSRTYQQKSTHQRRAAEVDPQNRLVWRRSVRRLEAEAIRDSLLHVSGDLDLAIGGRTLTHVENRAFLFDHTSRDGTNYNSRRRTIYLPVIRNHVCDALHLFDFPDPAVPSGDRATSTVAPQALYLLNSDRANHVARSLAQRILGLECGPPATPSDAAAVRRQRIRYLFCLAYGRDPTTREIARANAFIERSTALTTPDKGAGDPRLKAWQALCQVILAANEFVYVR